MLSNDFWGDFLAHSKKGSELPDWEKLKKIAKRVDNMRKDLYTSFDAMSNVLMIDLGLLYKVVLCPRSGEGYFGLARRTYSFTPNRSLDFAKLSNDFWVGFVAN